MNWLTSDQKQSIARLSSAAPEQEACGFVLADGRVIEVNNRAENPIEEFSISPQIYAHWDEVGIRGVWHSHLTLDGFSLK